VSQNLKDKISTSELLKKEMSVRNYRENPSLGPVSDRLVLKRRLKPIMSKERSSVVLQDD